MYGIYYEKGKMDYEDIRKERMTATQWEMLENEESLGWCECWHSEKFDNLYFVVAYNDFVQVFDSKDPDFSSGALTLPDGTKLGNRNISSLKSDDMKALAAAINPEDDGYTSETVRLLGGKVEPLPCCRCPYFFECAAMTE